MMRRLAHGVRSVVSTAVPALAVLAVTACSGVTFPATGAIRTSSGGAATPGQQAGATPSADVSPGVPLGRSEVDRPDDSTDFQFHALYVLGPAAQDLQFDTNGSLAAAIAEANAWFAQETGGARFRWDTSGGRPDISFLRLATELPAGDTPRMDALRAALKRAGLSHPRKFSVVFYGGPNPNRSTGAGLGGSGLALVEFDDCARRDLCQFDRAGLDFAPRAAIHEMLHAIGAVGAGAPHFLGDDEMGHTGDDRGDMMNSNDGAPGAYDPAILDPGRDDYYGHGRPDLFDAARSLFLEPIPADYMPPPHTQLALEPGTNTVAGPVPALPADLPGVPDVEDAVVAAVAARIQARHGRAPRDAVTMRHLARRYARDGNDAAFDFFAAARQAGVFAPVEARWLSFTPGASTSAQVAEHVADRLGSEALDAYVVGAGAYRDETFTYVALCYGQRPHDFADVAIGDGPFGTYTLSARLVLAPGQPATSLTAKVFTGENKTFEADFPAADPPILLISVPRDGAYRANVFVSETGGTSTLDYAGSFYVDGTRPAASALLFAEPAAVLTWPRFTWPAGSR